MLWAILCEFFSISYQKIERNKDKKSIAIGKKDDAPQVTLHSCVSFADCISNEADIPSTITRPAGKR
jgi:hypothetical protein